MKSYRKEIVISITALLFLIFAIIAFIQLISARKTSLETNIHTLIPPNAEAVLQINRPDLLRQTAITEAGIYKALAGEIPPVFHEIISKIRIKSALVSFQAQGAMICIPDGDINSIPRLLQQYFKGYKPQKQSLSDVDFHYFPDAGNRFFGYYIYNNVLVGSYSRKLLERTARQQIRSEQMIAEDLLAALESADRNSPASLVIPPSMISLEKIGEEHEINYICLDIFTSDGKICAYTHLPHLEAETKAHLADFFHKKYPHLNFAFQAAEEKNGAGITICCIKDTPVGRH
jgi:hypothetical protein